MLTDQQPWLRLGIATGLAIALAVVACDRTALTALDRKDSGIARPDLASIKDVFVHDSPADGVFSAAAHDAIADIASDAPAIAPDSSPADIAVVNYDSGPEAAIDVLGGAPGTGGRSGSGGADGGYGGYFGGGYGGRGLDWSSGTGGASSSCGSIPQIPGDAKSLCTFTGVVGGGCLASKVGVFVDSERTYFSLDHGLGIVQCPVGTTNSSVFVDDNARAPGEKDDWATLRGQTLANGTIRFVCSGYRRFGNDWDYRFTCGTSGVETIQPSLKDGDLYVLIPAAPLDGGLAGYQGHIYGYRLSGFGAQSVFFQPLGSGKEGSLGTYPVTYSVDGKTFWFNDPSGAQITIRLDAKFEVIDIQRQS